MKTNQTPLLLAALLGLSASIDSRCAEKENVATATPSDPTVQVVNSTGADVATVRWTDLKDIVFDNRVQFFAGLGKLEALVDAQMSALKTKRAGMNSTVDTKAWDFAMKEMVDARSYLKSMGEEAGKATPETWTQAKDKVGQAWVRTQAAYDKVRASTTT